MNLRLSAFVERTRSSLFLVPMVFVVGGVALGALAIEVDDTITADARSVPLVLTSTVDSARAVLSVVASATITVAGIAFSIALLVIQQAASQYSPRLVHSLFRDPFNRRVVGVAVGTFTYCLIVLRAVRDPLDEGGEAVVPNLSVALAVLFGVVAMAAIVGFIDHNAHTLEVSAILARVARESIDQVDRTWPPAETADVALEEGPPGAGHAVDFARDGWLQQVDEEALLELVPAGGTVRLETRPGRYAVAGTPLCTLWPPPEDERRAAARARRAVEVGTGRTMQQDPSYGVRQLVDVALIALSPGVNDPTTAQDAIFHLTSVLRAALVRDPPPAVVRGEDGRRLLRPEDHTHASLVGLAFDEIRRSSGSHPAVCAYLLEALHLLHEVVLEDGRPELAVPIVRQARLVLASAEAAGLLPEDLEEVREDHACRFDPQRSDRS